MPIESDFTVDYANKRVYHSAGTTVYDVNALYSWLMDTFDELVQMDDPVPMSAQTPTEYTMINEWFIDDESVKYLKNGAIKTSGYLNKIQVLKLLTAGYTNCVASDIGKQVQDDTVEIGVLLAYNNTTRKWWIRSASTVASGSAMTITAGTGAGTADGASVSGEDLFANIYTLGTVETVPYAQIYIFQAGEAIAEWSNLSNWDRGHIDVVIKVKEAGTAIGGSAITVFGRQSGDLYDNYTFGDLSAGGRNACPLSTADDLNEDTGEYYLLYDAETVGFTTIGQIVTGGTSGATAELVAVADWGTTGRLTLRGIKGTFQDNETITGSTEGSATVNGTVGDTYGTYSAVSVQLTVGLVCTGGTSTAKRILRGIQSDGATGKYVFQVSTTATGAARTPYYKAFSAGETITDTGTGSVTSGVASTTIKSGWSDITVAFVNGTITYSATSGALTPGERVVQATSGATAIFLNQTTTTGAGTATLGNVVGTFDNTNIITGDISGKTLTSSGTLTSAYTMNKSFEQQTAYPYAVIVQAGSIYQAGRTLAQVYEYFKFVCQENSTFKMYTVVSGVITPLDGEEYIIAYTGYTPSKAAPFGSFAGGKYFGAQGVWIEGMASGQSYQYTDSNGVIRSPYTSVTVAITSVVSGDKVAVFRTSAGVIDKAIYTSTATGNNINDPDFVVQEAIAVDTPSAGILRVYNADKSEERYPYSSWTGSTFTLDGVTLTKTYDATSTAYVPFIDKQATATSVEQVVLYTADRAVLIRVRKYAAGAGNSILPFETSGSVTTAGLSVAAIRTVDAIAT